MGRGLSFPEILQEGAFDATVRRQINDNFAAAAAAILAVPTSDAVTALQTAVGTYGGTHDLSTDVGAYAGASDISTQLAACVAALPNKPTVVAAPATAGDAGTAGTIAFDATHIYYCVSTGVWVRAELATWA